MEMLGDVLVLAAVMLLACLEDRKNHWWS